jgi:hypothetical protein
MRDFIEYIQGLAEHGETALLVKQQPIIRSGVHLSHGDGSLKYSWPAFMPTHAPKDGEAWYLNTGSFHCPPKAHGPCTAHQHVSASAGQARMPVAGRFDA